jgi:hypothetical protein
VVEAQQGQMQLAHDHVLVVTRITEQGCLLTVARHIAASRPIDGHDDGTGDLLGQEGSTSCIDLAVVQLW